MALSPGLGLSVKSEVWWIRGWWFQGWLSLASDSQYPAWAQRFLEPEWLSPELSWSIPACWFRAWSIQVWWSDPVWWFGLKFVRRLIRCSILQWMKKRPRLFRLPPRFPFAAKPPSRRPGGASEKLVLAA